MTLPAALQKQAAEAEAAIQALQQSQQNAPTVVTDPAQLKAETTPPAAPAPQPAPKAEVPPAPQPKPAPAPSEDHAKLLQQHRTLQGMFSSQSEKFRALEEEVARLKAAASAPPPAPAPEPPKPTATPKEVEDFGAPMIEFVQRMADQVFAAKASAVLGELQKLDGRLKALESGITTTQASVGQTREHLFFADLTRRVPDWEQINDSEEWRVWLGQVDPVYGAPRQAALDAAQERLNSERAAAVFDAFKAQRQAPAPAESPLESQIAPASVAPAPTAPTQVQQEVVWTQKGITKFYLDLQRGVYRGREAEAAALERSINEAAAAGRIR